MRYVPPPRWLVCPEAGSHENDLSDLGEIWWEDVARATEEPVKFRSGSHSRGVSKEPSFHRHGEIWPGFGLVGGVRSPGALLALDMQVSCTCK